MTEETTPEYLQSELQSLRQAAFRLAEEVEAIVNEQKRIAKKEAMWLAEQIKGPVVRRQIKQDFDQYIKRFAKDEFQIRVMRAIVFEEQVHEWPPFIEGRLEEIGFGDSIGPSQIRVSKWADKYRTNRRDILDPKTHFQTMRKLLDDVERKAEENGMKRTPENIGSLWNNLSARAPTDYGRRVKEFDDMLEKERTAAEQSQRLAAAQEEADRQKATLREREKHEAEEREADRKKQQEQRAKQTNYGPHQRSHLPSDSASHRHSESSSHNKERFESSVTRPTPAFPKPWPPEGWKRKEKAKEPPKEKEKEPSHGGSGSAPAPAPSRPTPPPAPPPEPPSKESLPAQGGGPIRML